MGGSRGGAVHLDASATGDGGGRAASCVPGRLGDRRWPQSLGQVARDGRICGESRAAGACNNSLDEATTVRCRLGAL